MAKSQPEFDKLVEIITESVSAALQPLVTSSKQDSGRLSTPAELTFNKGLLTETDALLAVRKKLTKVFIDKKTLITPLANDRFRQNRIKIMRTDSNDSYICGCEHPKPVSRTIGLLAVNCTQTARDTAMLVIREYGFDPVQLHSRNTTPSGIRKSTLDVTDQISQARLFAAVIIDETAFALKLQASRVQGARPAMCWDVAAKDYCAKDSKSNMLFVNNRLLGFRKLEQIMRVWMVSLQDEQQ